MGVPVTPCAFLCVPGTSYVVHCQLESAVGMPTVRGGQLDDKYFRFSATVQGKKAKTSRVECSNINESGVVVFGACPRISSRRGVSTPNVWFAVCGA